MQPEVSVIIPVYQVAEYVDECIASIAGQTFSEIEIILVDDGSTDGSAERCDDWARRDKRIVVIHQPNQGVSVARNAGLDTARGEWICFMDGDDFCESDLLEKMLRAAYDNDLVLCSYQSKRGGVVKKEHFFNGALRLTEEDSGRLIKMALGIRFDGSKGTTNIGTPYAKLYRRQFIEQYGIRFIPGLKRMQDTVFNLAVFNKMQKAYYIDEPLYVYRYRETSVTHRYTPDFSETVKILLQHFDREVMNCDRISAPQAVYDYKAIAMLIENIKLYYGHPDCNLSFAEKVQGVRELTKLPVYKEPLAREDAKAYLSRKQRLMKNLLQKNRCRIALLLTMFRTHDIIRLIRN